MKVSLIRIVITGVCRVAVIDTDNSLLDLAQARRARGSAGARWHAARAALWRVVHDVERRHGHGLSIRAVDQNGGCLLVGARARSLVVRVVDLHWLAWQRVHLRVELWSVWWRDGLSVRKWSGTCLGKNFNGA